MELYFNTICSMNIGHVVCSKRAFPAMGDNFSRYRMLACPKGVGEHQRKSYLG